MNQVSFDTLRIVLYYFLCTQSAEKFGHEGVQHSDSPVTRGEGKENLGFALLPSLRQLSSSWKQNTQKAKLPWGKIIPLQYYLLKCMIIWLLDDIFEIIYDQETSKNGGISPKLTLSHVDQNTVSMLPPLSFSDCICYLSNIELFRLDHLHEALPCSKQSSLVLSFHLQYQ